jgi:predicted amidohydrolase YtcJ
VLRTTLKGAVVGPDQAINVEEAVRAHTIDAAYSLFAEDRLGSIEPGKLADLTVLDGDLFGVDPDEIAGLEAWMTVLDGEVVHDPSGAAP